MVTSRSARANRRPCCRGDGTFAMITSAMLTASRRVDWSYLPEDDRPRMLQGATPSELAPLLAAFDEMIACQQSDAILRCALKAARERIGLTRVGFFLRDDIDRVAV